MRHGRGSGKESQHEQNHAGHRRDEVHPQRRAEQEHECEVAPPPCGKRLRGLALLKRLPPKSANTLHKHVRAEEFYFVIEGVGRIRVEDETLTVPQHGGVLVGPSQLRQVFNDTESEVLWLIAGAPEEMDLLAGEN